MFSQDHFKLKLKLPKGTNGSNSFSIGIVHGYLIYDFQICVKGYGIF